jgi:molybdopterin-synthase adenylyltransferase
VHGGCVGCHGQVMTFRPGKTICFRCLMGGVPEPGSGETCDTAGVLGPAVNVIASLQALDAIKILAGLEESIEPVLTVVDLWEGTFRRLKVGEPRDEGRCAGCLSGERPWLHGTHAARSAVLCGRNAVQITPPMTMQIGMDELATRLAASGRVTRNPFLVKLEAAESGYVLTVFRDGRAIVQGTEDPGVARSVYSRFVGM